MAGELIPISVFIVIGVVASLWFYFRHRTRGEVQASVRAAIDKGQELTPELIRSLGDALDPKIADMRRAFISIAVGLAFVIFALVLNEEEAQRPLIAMSAFPFLLGLAYLGLWRFAHNSA